VRYWTDVFTQETWEAASREGYRITGFPAPHQGFGGYTRPMLQGVQAGDIFVCYCKSPAMSWVGALQATSPVFQDDAPIWGLLPTGDARFPWRFATEPIVILKPSDGVPARSVLENVRFLGRLGPKWGALLQQSLRSVPESDGRYLVETMKKRVAGLGRRRDGH
jgi:hypothetical protein